METINLDDLKKIEIRIGQILSVEKIEGSEKLLNLKVSFGQLGVRTILSGIAKFFTNPDDLVSKKCAFAYNLAPKEMMGLVSQGMLLATSGYTESGEEFFSILEVGSKTPAGSLIK